MSVAITITRATIAGGKAVAPGEQITVSPVEAYLLIRLGKAVVTEPATETANADPGADPAAEAAVTPKRKR